MMSLYLKALEGERGMLPRKQHLLPSLGNNIKCGNSLIDYDIFDSPSPNPSPLRGEGKGGGGLMIQKAASIPLTGTQSPPDSERS